VSGAEKRVMLADPHQALERYLEGLLTVPPPAREPMSPPTPVVAPPVAERAPARPARPARVDAPAVKPRRIDAPVAELPLSLPAPRPADPPSLKGRELVPFQPKPTPTGPPDWAAEPFPCLLFRVAGLTLAVPLLHLNGVRPWPEEITPMPGHQPWFLGLVRHQGQQAKVVDTALLVVPPERLATARDESEPGFGNVVLIDEGRWGLACERVDEMITLDPSGVRWRTRAGKRPWLAGTVIAHMCALIDPLAFAEMLASGER
jgi:purine-binding chemotaxis protein CheW